MRIELKKIVIDGGSWKKEYYEVFRDGCSASFCSVWPQDDGTFTVEEPVFKSFKSLKAVEAWAKRQNKTLAEMFAK